MPKLELDRRILAQFLPNPQAISAFEQVFTAVGTTLPNSIEEANALAAQAVAAAAQALAMLAELASAVSTAEAAPPASPEQPRDDLSPPGVLPAIADDLSPPGLLLATADDLAPRATGDALEISISNNEALNATTYPLWAAGTNGSYQARTTSAKWTFNPFTGLMICSSFSGQFNGTLGITTPAAAVVTTLTATGNVTLSPGGAGTVVINPASSSSAMDNVGIGASTPRPGAFTTLRGRSSVWADRAATAANAVMNWSTADTYDWQLYTDAGANPALILYTAGVGEVARWNTARNMLLGTTVDGMTAGGSLAVAKDFAHRGSKLGILNTAPVAKQSVVGSRGGNAALASLLTALATYGLITDSTTA